MIIAVWSSCNSPAADVPTISVGEQIRAARLRRQISQAQLAAAVGMTQNAISLIEDGIATPIHTKTAAIEQYLGCTLVYD